MSEIIPGLHQFGVTEANELKSMDLVIDVGGITSRIGCQYLLNNDMNTFKDALNTPVLLFELDESTEEPIRQCANKLLQVFSLAIVGHAYIASGLNVGVVCAAGQNRSGLICALILMIFGYSPQRAIEIVREKRENALNNPKINELITSIEWRYHQFSYLEQTEETR